VEIIATFTDPKSGQRHLILERQYRPPVAAVCVEFPAGLIDHNLRETPEQAALRELREECGFVGKVIHVSTAFAYEPSLTNERGCLVRIEAEPAPQKTEFDSDEFIETLVIPLATLSEQLSELSKTCLVDGKVLAFAMSLEEARKSLL
jgi:ADP-ribose pyrophosphatase